MLRAFPRFSGTSSCTHGRGIGSISQHRSLRFMAARSLTTGSRTEGVVEKTVETDFDGSRLDRWIRHHFPQIPHSLLNKLLRKREVVLIGSSAPDPGVTISTRLTAGTVVRLPYSYLQTTPAKVNRTKPIDAASKTFMESLVLYKDEDIIALNKPPALPVQGGTKSQERNLDMMLKGLVDLEKGEEIPRLIHRLDRDTSGVMIVARTRAAAQKFSRWFRTKGIVEKCYLAVTYGRPEQKSGRIKMALSKVKDEDGRESMQGTPEEEGETEEGQEGTEEEGEEGEEEKMGEDEAVDIDEGGGDAAKPKPPRIRSKVYGDKPPERKKRPKMSITEFQMLEHAEELSLMALFPITGRTHQLRVHCATALNCSIVGDKKYGKSHINRHLRNVLTTDTLHLHSYALRISDPAKPGKKVVIQAPLPPHMQNTFRTFDFNASPNVDWVEDNLKAKFKPEERKKHRLWEERAKTKKGKGARNIGATKTMQQRAIKAQKVKLAKTRQRARAKEKAKSSAKRK